MNPLLKRGVLGSDVSDEAKGRFTYGRIISIQNNDSLDRSLGNGLWDWLTRAPIDFGLTAGSWRIFLPFVNAMRRLPDEFYSRNTSRRGDWGSGMLHDIPHPPSPHMVIAILFGASPMMIVVVGR